MPEAEKIRVKNVNVPGHVSNVDAVKYHAVKKVILKVLPKKAPGMTFTELCDLCKPHLEDLFPGGAKVGWWSKTVQLDLEARGHLVRENTKPLRWYKG